MSKATTTPQRRHRATYASDRKTGGYLIRVAGPQASAFAGREVPVVTKAGEEHIEKLERLIWGGKDQDTGEPVALYKFAPKPRTRDEGEATF